MTETQVTLTRQALKTPKSAAIAGIIFALLYGASMVLMNISLSQESTAGLARTVTDPRTVALALNLIPYAGIAFLWFIGVIRDLLGDREDRLFATVFLGSGLLFLALTFMGAALAAGLLSAYTGESGVLITKRCIDLRPIGDISCLQHLCHPHGRCVHDFTGHNLAPYRRDAPWLGLSDVRAGTGVAAEYRLFLLGDLDLTGMGDGG